VKLRLLKNKVESCQKFEKIQGRDLPPLRQTPESTRRLLIEQTIVNHTDDNLTSFLSLTLPNFGQYHSRRINETLEKITEQGDSVCLYQGRLSREASMPSSKSKSARKRPPIVATATTPATLSGNGTLPPNRTSSPGSANAALSSALRPQTDSLSVRGGTPHNHTAFTSNPTTLGLDNLVAMDLKVPEPAIATPTIEISSTSNSSSTSLTSLTSDQGGAPLKRGKKSVDKGYDGDTVREKLTNMSRALNKQNGVRDYLSGMFSSTISLS